MNSVYLGFLAVFEIDVGKKKKKKSQAFLTQTANLGEPDQQLWQHTVLNSPSQ